MTDSEPTQETAGQSEDSFFDPNTVPEELLPAYKQMQAAFTKKTQEVAQTRKQAEQLQKQAEAFKKYEQYVPVLEEMLSNQAPTTNPQIAALKQRLKSSGYTDEAIDLVIAGTEFTLNTMQQQTQQQQFQSRLETEISKAEQLDPRLNDDTITYQTEDGQEVSYGEIVQSIVLSDSKWTQDPVSATKRAIKVVDALIGKAKSQGKEELSASARSKASRFPSTNSSPQSATSNSQPSTIAEAAALAEKQIGHKF